MRDAAAVLAFAANPPLGTDPRDLRGDSYCYTPCLNGIHVCGYHPDGENCLTVANLPVGSPEEARTLFDACRAECAATDGEADDFVVDLQQRGDCQDDFVMSRQMLDRLVHIWAKGGPA